MPLIVVNTNLNLEKEKKDSLKSELGRIIELLPGKTEQQLMVDISDGHTIYFHGEEAKQTAYIDVRMYGSQSFESKAEFTSAVFEVAKEQLGLENDEVFVNIGEYGIWGARGALK